MEDLAIQQLSRQTFTCSKLTIKTLKQHKKNIKANSFTFLCVFISNFEHNSYFFSSVSNSVCKHTLFSLNMTTIMVVTMTTYVNATVITTMIATPTITKTKNNACNYG